MEEDFRNIYIPGYGVFNNYKVSKDGVIASVDHIIIDKMGRKQPRKGKTLTPTKEANGYLRVWLGENFNKKYSVHRIVAFAFPEICGEWFEGCQVNHKNEVKTDNRASNLEVCTSLENNIYGTRIEKAALKNKGKGKPILMLKNGKPFFLWKTVQEAKENGFPDKKSLWRCLKNSHKTYKGFTFEYF